MQLARTAIMVYRRGMEIAEGGINTTAETGLTARQTMTCLWAAGLMSVLASVWLLAWYLPGSLPLTHVSGIITAWADDFAKGIFYRPLFDNGYYGGTRYMPLFPVLYGLIMPVVGDPATAGRIMTFASGLLMLGMLFLALRASKVRRGAALGLTLVALASVNVRFLALEVRADFLAAGLNLAGLWLCLEHGDKGGRWRPVLAALAFGLTVVAKLSTMYGLAAVFLFWLIHKRVRAAIFLAFASALVVALALAATYAVSSGRAWESFAACASGGMDWLYAVKAPFWLLATAGQDPFLLLIVLLGLGLGTSGIVDGKAGLPHWYLALTLAATLVLFSSPGVDGNHILDLFLASLLVIGVELERRGYRSRVAATVFGLVALLTVFTWVPGLPSIRHYVEKPGRPTREAVARIQQMIDKRGPIMSENPGLPVLMGQRAVVLDAFQLPLISRERPEIRESFFRRLRGREFSGVVLMDWSGAPRDRLEQEMEAHSSLGGKKFYGDVHFFPGFLETLKAGYRITLVDGPFVLFQPRPTPEDAS